MLRLKAALSVICGNLRSVFIGFIGLAASFAWALSPIPKRSQLVEISGPLISYSIEADSAAFARRLSRDVLFKVGGYQGRFWSDAVGPRNVRKYFTHLGAAISVYRSSQRTGNSHGGGVKTWGLTVEGREIQSVDEALSNDRILAMVVLPIFGIAMLVFAASKWRRAGRSMEEQFAEM